MVSTRSFPRSSPHLSSLSNKKQMKRLMRAVKDLGLRTPQMEDGPESTGWWLPNTRRGAENQAEGRLWNDGSRGGRDKAVSHGMQRVAGRHQQQEEQGRIPSPRSQNCERTHSCCSRPPSVWSLVRAYPGSHCSWGQPTWASLHDGPEPSSGLGTGQPSSTGENHYRLAPHLHVGQALCASNTGPQRHTWP